MDRLVGFIDDNRASVRQEAINQPITSPKEAPEDGVGRTMDISKNFI